MLLQASVPFLLADSWIWTLPRIIVCFSVLEARWDSQCTGSRISLLSKVLLICLVIFAFHIFLLILIKIFFLSCRSIHYPIVLVVHRVIIGDNISIKATTGRTYSAFLLIEESSWNKIVLIIVASSIYLSGRCRICSSSLCAFEVSSFLCTLNSSLSQGCNYMTLIVISLVKLLFLSCDLWISFSLD